MDRRKRCVTAGARCRSHDTETPRTSATANALLPISVSWSVERDVLEPVMAMSIGIKPISLPRSNGAGATRMPADIDASKGTVTWPPEGRQPSDALCCSAEDYFAAASRQRIVCRIFVRKE